MFSLKLLLKAGKALEGRGGKFSDPDTKNLRRDLSTLRTIIEYDWRSAGRDRLLHSFIQLTAIFNLFLRRKNCEPRGRDLRA